MFKVEKKSFNRKYRKVYSNLYLCIYTFIFIYYKPYGQDDQLHQVPGNQTMYPYFRSGVIREQFFPLTET